MAAAAALNINLAPFSDPITQNWQLWRLQFQSMVTLRAMDHQQARLALHQLVQGEAAEAVQDIEPVNGQATIGNMLTAYQARFLTTAAGDMARAELQAAMQRASETVLGFHARIRALYT